MERIAALALASRIEATWSDRPWPQARSGEWINALETLDEGAAGTAFVRLRASGREHITIAAFVTAVKAIQGDDTGTTSSPLAACSACDGTGFVECADYNPGWNDLNGKPIVYSQVRRCSCAGPA